jgi:HEAT repeat protein
MLLARLGDSDKDKAGNVALVRVTDQLLAKEHGPLLVPVIADKRVSARRYAAQKLFQFAQDGLKPTFNKMRTDADAEVALAGSLGLARLGDLSCLDSLIAPTAHDWKKKGNEIREAVKGLKGGPATLKLMEMLAKEDATMKTAALRLLAVAGTKDAVMAVKPYLDKDQGQIKKEAINALRGIVDGDPPLEDLSIFDAIEMAKQWKGRT